MTKGKKKPADIIAAKARQASINTDVAGFNIGGRKYLETGVSANKLSQVAAALSKSGQVTRALSVADRAFVKKTGQYLGRSKAIARKEPMGNWTKGGNTIENMQELRGLTRDVFQKRPGPGKQPGRILQEQASKNTVIVPRASANARMQKFAKAKMAAGEKYRQSLGGKVTRVAELEKRLNFPKRGR
jgi:hypothetical protein